MELSFFTDVIKSSTEDGGFYIEGVASTTDVDKQRDMMSAQALADMAKSAIGVPITIDHTNEAFSRIGKVVKAWVDNGKLFIKAKLRENDPLAARAYSLVQENPNEWGLSVNGIAELAYGAGVRIAKSMRVFKHIMLTSQPVNQNTFVAAVSKALDEKTVSVDERDEHATYFTEENGKKVGHFPIFDEQSAEAALHLIGHAPANEQSKIRAKACSILGPNHPACAEVSKSEDTMETNELSNIADVVKAEITKAIDELSKAGKAISADTASALKDIHDSAGDAGAVRSKVRALLGDDADKVLGAAPAAGSQDLADGDGDDNENVGGDNTVGLINKSEPAGLTPEQKTEIANVVKSAIAELKPSVHQETVEQKPAFANKREALDALLTKVCGG